MTLLATSVRVLERLLGRVVPDRTRTAQEQLELNRTEVSGAPGSRLRLWRAFLGWCLALCFVWEVMLRPVILTYRPETLLPPSVLGEVSRVLLGMLGLGV